jgi:hypothetical protein
MDASSTGTGLAHTMLLIPSDLDAATRVLSIDVVLYPDPGSGRLYETHHRTIRHHNPVFCILDFHDNLFPLLLLFYSPSSILFLEMLQLMYLVWVRYNP